MRFAERFGSLSPLKKIGGCGFCTGFAPKPHRSKSANSPWYSKRSFVQMPCMISIVSRTCLCRLGKMCEALAAANSSGIQPDPRPTLILPFDRWSTVAISAARTAGARYGVSVMLMPIRTFDRLRREPGDQRPALVPLATGRHGQRLREPLDHAERVLELLAVGGFRHHDPVERPDRVEVELLGEGGEILELLDGHLVAEIRQVESELHGDGLLVVRRVERQSYVSARRRVAQFPLDDLAVVVGRQGVDESVVLGPLEPGDVVEARLVESLDRWRGGAIDGHYESHHRLAPLRVGPADDCDGPHAGVAEHRLFDLAGVDVHAAADDEVLGAVPQREVARPRRSCRRHPCAASRRAAPRRWPPAASSSRPSPRRRARRSRRPRRRGGRGRRRRPRAPRRRCAGRRRSACARATEGGPGRRGRPWTAR